MLRIFILLSSVILIGLSACTSNQADMTNPEKTENTDKKSGPPQKIKSGKFEPPDSTYSGDYFEKYPSGVVKVRGFFRFGKKDGKWMYFYPNGTLWSEAFFKADKMDGESNVYHPNGQLMYSGFYNMNVADSIWHYYDTTGKLTKTTDYNLIRKNKGK